MIVLSIVWLLYTNLSSGEVKKTATMADKFAAAIEILASFFDGGDEGDENGADDGASPVNLCLRKIRKYL